MPVRRVRATRELGSGTDTKPRASQELAVQKGKASEKEITPAKEETTDTQAEDTKKVRSPSPSAQPARFRQT